MKPRTAPRKLSVVGLGKLGLCLAAVLASKGFEVAGVELDGRKVAAVNAGRSPIAEPGLQELISKNRARLTASTEFGEAVRGSEATFVVVPTPSAPSGGFSLRFVTPAVREIGVALRGTRQRHVVVVTSTVMPGSMENSVKPALERASGKRCPRDVGLCYNPEFIALGDVIRGMLNPDMVLIGESDGASGELVQRIHRQMCDVAPDFQRMSFVNAELAKISVNSYVTMKMTFANTLAQMCESLPGADVDVVTNAIGADRRIGRKYLKGAVGYGGPCFPRDNVAFAKLAQVLGAQAELAVTTHKVNRAQVRRLLALARRRGLKSGMPVAVLGLSYKPDTNIVDESQGVALCNLLVGAGFAVRAYDPEANENARTALAKGVELSSSAAEAVAASRACFIVTPWEQFRELGPEAFEGKMLVDCWRLIPGAAQTCKEYVPVGVSAQKPGEAPALKWR